VLAAFILFAVYKLYEMVKTGSIWSFRPGGFSKTLWG
jgi:hypothetical protein